MGGAIRFVAPQHSEHKRPSASSRAVDATAASSRPTLGCHKNSDDTPVFQEVAIRLHGEREEDSLVMPDSMAAAYEDARAYYQARQQPSAGILKTLLLRRIGSSLHAGLLTAKRLRDGRVH